MPTLELGDVRLRYEQSGAVSGPVLVLSNSLGSNLHMWDKVLPWLEKSLRILRYDTRGHGKSSVPPAPYSIEQMGSDLLLLMDHLSIDRVHVCGLSLGGLVSIWLGIHAPERFERMIFANTAARMGWPCRPWSVGSRPLIASSILRRWRPYARCSPLRIRQDIAVVAPLSVTPI